MKTSFKLITLLFFFNTPLLATAAGDTDCTSLKGAWIDERGSTLRIKTVDEKNGQISGTYQLPAGVDPTEYDLIGWFSQGISGSEKKVVSPVSFSVRWKALGSITSWSGTCEEISGNAEIKLVGHQVKLHARVPNERITTQLDTFQVKQ